MALRIRFHAQPGQLDNFDTLTPDAIRGFIDQVLGMIAAVVVPVTCISLVVGGIVIMNIMLVSVTGAHARNRACAKSLGARHRDVMMQILIEAVTLSSLGGALGVALGAVVTTRACGAMFEISHAHHARAMWRWRWWCRAWWEWSPAGIPASRARQAGSGGGAACGVRP